MKPSRVVVAILTIGADDQLKRTLDSVVGQILPSSVIAEAVVIDMSPDQGANRMTTEYDVDYVMRVGYLPIREMSTVAAARNTGLLHARTRGADYVVFLDRGTRAHDDWLAELMAPDLLDADVLTSRCVTVPPERPPYFYLHPDGCEYAHGDRVLLFHASGTRFSIGFINAGLRFDMSLSGVGQEDILMSAACREAGVKARYNAKATINDFADAFLYTLRAHIYYSHCVEFSRHVAGNAALWRFKGLTASAIIMLLCSYSGLAGLIASPVMRVFAGQESFKRCVVDAVRDMGRGVGIMRAILWRAGFVHAPLPHTASRNV